MLPVAVAVAVQRASRGDYQESVLSGYEAWSGSSLKGRAKQWAGRYADSRRTLLQRIQTALLPLGWSADTALVRLPGENRDRRLLLLWPPRARVWATEWVSEKKVRAEHPRRST